MSQETVAGIDVSKACARRSGPTRVEDELETAQFANDAAGYRKLVAWLTQRGQSGARRPGADRDLQSRGRTGVA